MQKEKTKMKKAMIFAALCAAVLAGCGKKDSSSVWSAIGCVSKAPEAVAQKFLECKLQGDIDCAKKYMSKYAIKDFEALIEKTKKKMGEKVFNEMTKKAKEKAKGIKFTKKNVKIDGNIATVTFSLSEEGEKITLVKEVTLVKEDGGWKVIMK